MVSFFFFPLVFGRVTIDNIRDSIIYTSIYLFFFSSLTLKPQLIDNAIFEIPELDSELKDELNIVVINKTYDPSKSNLSWETGILPKLIARLDQLCRLSQQGERFGKPKGVDLPETINKINETIKNI